MLYRVWVVDTVSTGHPRRRGCDVTQAESLAPTQNEFRPQTGLTTPTAYTENRKKKTSTTSNKKETLVRLLCVSRKKATIINAMKPFNSNIIERFSIEGRKTNKKERKQHKVPIRIRSKYM